MTIKSYCGGFPAARSGWMIPKSSSGGASSYEATAPSGAVNATAFGAFLHQGQICMSARRIIVERPIADAFIERLTEKTKGLKTGDPKEHDTIIGPLINESALQSVKDRVADAVSRGARVLAGGQAEGEARLLLVGHAVAQPLQRFAQVDAMTIDLVAAFFQSLRDVHRRDRTIQRALLARFALELEHQRAKLIGLSLGRRAFIRFFLQQPGALLLDLLDVVCGRFHCQLTRQEIIASIARTDANNLTAGAQIVDVFS